ncbi:GNAT family N-acetyltransferase [Hephaestia sp. GCM10023244]|uniref:GNAT family N-acetyltransferase n=1 Tax=unclassified Hephaestia TaxID=2631281 RepID=UPI0020777F9A|nr:GNAT family N-acetyltransferase [Hephaestia sp. MAHUQ-44]MCM8731134.1 GNAT family N-acetyltransferase [Hephaestia sp. MAHUQ-44]
MAHPLDRPIWTALTTRQAGFAVGDAQALRFDPEVALFAAAADSSPDSRAALVRLVPPGGTIGLVERGETTLPEGLRIVKQAACVQMLAPQLSVPEPTSDVLSLGEADAAAMLALATLTEPGPFFARTHTLGDFVGVSEAGQLVAMAGERLKVPGFTEVSGVCTRPGWRGRGYAAALLGLVARRIVARGDTPFLHAYADHAATIALYERLGFVVRARMTYTILAR